LCSVGQDPNTCLTAAQVDALEKVYEGPRNPRTGEEIYPGLVRGSERGWGGHTAGPNIFSTADQFFKFMVYNDPTWDYRTFDFDSDLDYTDTHFSQLLDAIDPDLSAFKKHGGKILFSHLWSSTTHTATRSIEYGAGREWQQCPRRFRLASLPGAMGRARYPTDEHPCVPQDQRRRRPHAAFVPLSRGRGLHGAREHRRGGKLRLPKLGWSPTRPPSRRPTLISRPGSGTRKTRRQAPCLFVFEGNELARYSLTRETEIGQDRFGLSTHVLSAQCTTR